jgi:hypothetical protein
VKVLDNIRLRVAVRLRRRIPPKDLADLIAGFRASADGIAGHRWGDAPSVVAQMIPPHVVPVGIPTLDGRPLRFQSRFRKWPVTLTFVFGGTPSGLVGVDVAPRARFVDAESAIQVHFGAPVSVFRAPGMAGPPELRTIFARDGVELVLEQTAVGTGGFYFSPPRLSLDAPPWSPIRGRTTVPFGGLEQATAAIPQLARTIADAITDATSDERGAVGALTEVVPIDNSTLGREIIGLKRAAAFLALGGELSQSPELASQLTKDIDDHIIASLGGSGELTALETRRQEYMAAMNVFADNHALFHVTPGAEMLEYTEDAASNVGKLFAFICRSERNPVAQAIGSSLFVLTIEAVRTAFDRP